MGVAPPTPTATPIGSDTDTPTGAASPTRVVVLGEGEVAMTGSGPVVEGVGGSWNAPGVGGTVGGVTAAGAGAAAAAALALAMAEMACTACGGGDIA